MIAKRNKCQNRDADGVCRCEDVARRLRKLANRTWRRGHRVRRNPKDKPEDCPLISNATVNRSTTEVCKKLFTRAKTAWGVRFTREPNWKAHFLSEPEERVRELVGDEAERLDAATRDDYAPCCGMTLGQRCCVRQAI
jgi:hypothetical protein